jgi:uncharacterized protein (UPF0548 family)
MFLVARPSLRDVDGFLRDSIDRPLSYAPVGLARGSARGFRIDEQSIVVGSGEAAFARARVALAAWAHFDLGWVELRPSSAPIETGTVVAVVVRHLGFWSLNGARIVYAVGDRTGDEFGFAYGTLTNHAESGEEVFSVAIDRSTGDVRYSIRAASRPRAALARAGFPVVRLLQSRFRADSALAMRRAIAGGEGS